MPHSRRAALVLDCGHLAPPRGRIEGAPPLVGNYVWCPVCAAFHEVVALGRYLHAVPAPSGTGRPMTAPAAGRSPSPTGANLRLVPGPPERPG